VKDYCPYITYANPADHETKEDICPFVNEIRSKDTPKTSPQTE
jgi:hypothetical protein